MSSASRPLTLADVLEQMADSVPDRAAVVSKEGTLTYAELDERATRLANHLLSLGAKRGDHVRFTPTTASSVRFRHADGCILE